MHINRFYIFQDFSVKDEILERFRNKQVNLGARKKKNYSYCKICEYLTVLDHTIQLGL